MHISNKKYKSVVSPNDWYHSLYDDSDFLTDDNCYCNDCLQNYSNGEQHSIEELYVANSVANKIIYTQKIGDNIKNFIINERLSLYMLSSIHPNEFYSDVTYILPELMNSDIGMKICAKILGEKQ